MAEFDPSQFGGQPIEVTFDPAKFGAIGIIDENRGAPSRIRTAVGAAATPQDKLDTLRMYYPDAKPWGGDNYVFHNPDSGTQTLFNPKGLDMGDISENARMIFEFVGGGIGASTALVAGQLGPQIATPEEIVTVPAAAGVGAAAGGKVYDVIADLFYPNYETRTIAEQTADVGIDVLANAVGHRAGELVELGVKKGLSKGASLARKGSDEIMKAFKDSGVNPMAGSVSGSETLQGIEQALSRLPASADIIGDKLAKTIDDMGAYALKIVNRLSPSEGRESVGVAVRSGTDRFVRQFQQTGSRLYDKIDEFVPKGRRIDTANFGDVLDDTLKQFSADPEFAKILDSPFIKSLRSAQEASTDGKMAYGTLKALRTKIGSALDDSALISDTSQAELKRLYGALSDDMGRAAAESGEGGLQAYTRANAYWNAGRSRIDDVLKPVTDKAMNQDIFQAVMSGTKAGSERLRAFKKSLPEQDWNKLVAQQIREMGKANPGAQDVSGELFSPATFLTNFNKLSKDAQKTLFSNREFIGLGKAVDNLATMSAALKDTSKMANTSGTAQQMRYMMLLTGGLGGVYGAQQGEDPMTGAVQGMAISTLAPYAAAKLITSPAFINWLADGTKVVASGVSAHLGRLAAIAEKNEDLKPAIYEYMNGLSIKRNNDTAGDNQPNMVPNAQQGGY